MEVVVPGSTERLLQTVEQVLGKAGLEAQPEIRQGERALEHVYRVAAGLESPILGETEILTQFRQRLIEEEDSGRVDGVFARALQTAIAVGRQARELLPGSPHNSMAAIAAQAVGSAGDVAVLGSGVIGTAVVDALVQLPAPPKVAVFARNPDKVAARPDVQIIPFGEASAAISRFAAVVSATSAKKRFVDDEVLASALENRSTALTLIDMAMPPDFAPPPKNNITYFNIDDLARMANRRPRSDEADAMVRAAASEAYRVYRDHHDVGPVIGNLMRGADVIVDDVVARFAGRLGNSDDEETLRQTAHTVARTLLAKPVSYLKGEQRSSDALDVIADAFGVADG